MVADDVPPLAAMQKLFAKIGTAVSQEYTYYYKGEDAVRHLFRVAAGMDSLVIGEGQILSQVKVAYLTAVRVGTTGTISNMLFQRALAIGKKNPHANEHCG